MEAVLQLPLRRRHGRHTRGATATAQSSGRLDAHQLIPHVYVCNLYACPMTLSSMSANAYRRICFLTPNVCVKLMFFVA